MKYSKVSNARYANAEKTLVTVDVHFDHLGEVVPFAASPNDCEEHGRKIYEEVISGKHGAIMPFVPKLPRKNPVTLQTLLTLLVNKGIITTAELEKLT